MLSVNIFLVDVFSASTKSKVPPPVPIRKPKASPDIPPITRTQSPPLRGRSRSQPVEYNQAKRLAQGGKEGVTAEGLGASTDSGIYQPSSQAPTVINTPEDGENI